MSVDVIFIDDEKSIRDAVQQTIELDDLNVICFSNATQALKTITCTFSGIIITDINMPMMDGMALLKHALLIDKELPIVMLTGHGDISTAVNAMREGAYDFIEKPFATTHLLDVIHRGIDKRRLILENRDLRQELDLQTQPGPRLLGNTHEIQQIRRVLAHQKGRQNDLLICGAQGSGKKLAARFLQPESTQFFATQCTYTTVSQIIHQANNIPSYETALFYLEGIDHLEDQFTLATWLTTKPSHVRFVASSQQTPQWLSNPENFNIQLYLQLSTITISMPSLVERKEDIELLFNNFCRNAASRFGLTHHKLNDSERRRLFEHPWPDNIHELRMVAERFVLLGKGLQLASPHTSNNHQPLADMVIQFESNILSDALQRHEGRLKDVQEELGLARKTLYDKLKKHNIDKGFYKDR